MASRRRPRAPRIPWKRLADAAVVDEYALDLTHPLYRYPASMSPHLARALVLGLSRPGDTILDAFCGGGTTAVEALAHGRLIMGSDLNRLACFTTRAKAWPLNDRALKHVQGWVTAATRAVARPVMTGKPVVTVGGHEYAPKTHAALVRARDLARKIPDSAARRFALLIVLRVGQRCFHCRATGPSPAFLQRIFERTSVAALARMQSYAEKCFTGADGQPMGSRMRVMNCDAVELPRRVGTAPPISLVITSPPYPGVHVLYHRWQVLGRRETSLPYQLVGAWDGRPESHYGLGSRFEPENRTYFERLGKAFSAMHDALAPEAIVAQVVGFANPRQQLPRFREVLDAAGYEEIVDPDAPQRVISRVVPHRQWYNAIAAERSARKEFLLLHRARPTTR